MGASPMSPRGPMGGPMKSPLGGNGNNPFLPPNFGKIQIGIVGIIRTIKTRTAIRIRMVMIRRMIIILILVVSSLNLLGLGLFFL